MSLPWNASAVTGEAGAGGGGLTRVVDAASIGFVVARIGLASLYDMAIERLAAFGAAGELEQRERDGFLLHDPHDGLLEWMPAVRHGSTVSVKLVGYNPHNPREYRLPTILSTLCAFDVATGHLRSVVDGTFATAIRTGAASAVASRMLAAPGSYAELDLLAAVAARVLREEFGIGRGDVVLIAAEAGSAFTAVTLGVLRAGAAYLPVDLSYPADRIATICRASTAALVVTDGARDRLLASTRQTTLDHLLSGEQGEVVRPELSGDDASYVIFTSGSTGMPVWAQEIFDASFLGHA
jgi:hypothetical protein